MPAVTPVTTPVDDPTVAFAELLLHVPLDVTSLSVVVAAGQTVVVPVIELTVGSELFTVIIDVAYCVPQPLVTAYDIVVVPADTPVTIPDEAPIVACAELLLHTPPDTPSLNVVVDEVQT